MRNADTTEGEEHLDTFQMQTIMRRRASQTCLDKGEPEMVMEKDERDQQKANNLFRLLEKKIDAQGTQEKKRIAQTSRNWILCLKSASGWAGWHWTIWPLHGQVYKCGLGVGACLYLGGGRRSGQNKDSVKLARKKTVLEKKALKICLVASTPWGQQCCKLQPHEQCWVFHDSMALYLTRWRRIILKIRVDMVALLSIASQTLG